MIAVDIRTPDRIVCMYRFGINVYECQGDAAVRCYLVFDNIKVCSQKGRHVLTNYDYEYYCFVVVLLVLD